ncbi:MAG: S8 family serine peptidase [Phycisphaerales bacterium]
MRIRVVALVCAAGACLAAPAWAQVSADDSVGSSSAHPAQAAGRNRVTLPGGAVIHSTDRPISGARTVHVPGTPIVIALWNEGGTPFYAYSLDGQTLSGRARETSYTVGLRYMSFDPAVSTPNVGPAMAAPAGSSLYLVQFVAAPIPQIQAHIEAMGGKVLRFLADHTLIVSMTPSVKAAVQSRPHVRWVGSFHPAYKLDESLLTLIGNPGDAPSHVSIECFEEGPAPKAAVAARIAALGGSVTVTSPDGYRMQAVLTPGQILEVARMDEVHFMDPWGPGGHDMNIVRSIGGANFIETTLGFTGQGVRGEVFDSELRTTHQEFTGLTPLNHSPTFGNPLDPHGTSVFSIVFGQGTSANARGLLPDSEEQIFYWYGQSTQFGGPQTRLAANTQLLAAPYNAVFQTSSIGSPQTTVYTTISAEVDNYLYLQQLLSTQSQSNTSNNNSRPQAWAKNIVSCAAVDHFNTLSRADDTRSGTSIGPAADGRLKPDLLFFYDLTFAASNASNVSYTEFGGTSGATPSCGGYFGLFHQMWHEGVWAGRGGASTVFASRPKPTTAKAALCNTAFRYNWLLGGANGNVTRAVQGWGMPDFQNLYASRAETFIVDEDDVIAPLGSKTYFVRVPRPQTVNFTMCYVDRQGPTSATQHRINDLSMRVTSPTGTFYWGNNGLSAGNFSTSGGVSNIKDTVENVFVQNASAGIWRIEVFGDEILQDTHSETAAIDADFGLWVSGAVQARGPYGYSVNSNSTDHLYRIELPTGEATDLGLVGNGDLEGVSFGPRGDIFGTTGTTPGEFWNITSPPGALVGPAGPRVGTDAGLDYFQGTMYDLQGVASGGIGTNALYSVNTATGAPTLIGNGTVYMDNLAINTLGDGYGVAFGFAGLNLYEVNLTNAANTLVGPIGFSLSVQAGSSFSSDHRLWILADDELYTANTSSGTLTKAANIQSPAGAALFGFEGLGVDKNPSCVHMVQDAFVSTFSGTAATRGYWFTSPVNFEICGLRVPNEAGEAVQNVEVVRLNAAPPAFPAVTNSFESLGRFSVPAGGIIPVNIAVGQGDVIGILGACGTATMRNSYGSAGAFNTTIKGQPVTLTRFGMQFNLNELAAHDVWQEPAATFSRVELYYKDGRRTICLDADTPATGSTLPGVLSTFFGPVGFAGELVAFATSDPEFFAAGALGNQFDFSAVVPTAELSFGFTAETVTFIYGGNSGGIEVEALNAANAIVASFTQADTFAGQPAGPVTLAAPGIRKLRWRDPAGGAFAGLDNICIRSVQACYADCNGSGTLTVADFGCFQGQYVLGDMYADCNGSGNLTVADFGCFQGKYVLGCP